MNKERVDILLKEGKMGDKKALEELIKIHKGLIYKYSTRYFVKGYDREDLEQIAWIEFIKGVRTYDGRFGVDFVAFITILLRNKYGSMLKKKESLVKTSSLDAPIGEDITLKDSIEDDFSLEEDYEHREDIKDLKKAINSLDKEEREFLLFINEKRGNMQRYYEKHKDLMTFNAVRYKKKKILNKVRKFLES